MSGKSGRKQAHEADEPWVAGFKQAAANLLLAPVLSRCNVRAERPEDHGAFSPAQGWAIVDELGYIHVNTRRQGTPAQWAYVFAHAALHLAFGHHVRREKSRAWNAAACMDVTRFLDALKVGSVPEQLVHGPIPSLALERAYAEFARSGAPDEYAALSLAGPGQPDLFFNEESRRWDHTEWGKIFAAGLTDAVSKVLEKSSETGHAQTENTVGQRARRWIVDHFPLLGGLAMQLALIEDATVIATENIGLAAVNPQLGEVYLNSRRLTEEEARFVLAHEYLHVGLSHSSRRSGRDPYLWNVACDYVINGWLIELGLGRMPQVGVLHDPELKGLSAEAIYDRIVHDLRRYRKLATLRGHGEVDVLEGGRATRTVPDGMTLDAFYRQCLAHGLEYHLASGRGLLPAGLVQEIRALAIPPVPWDVELARLFDAWFPPLDRRRSYARPSRRQSSTPDIPRPSTRLSDSDLESRTFGVVLDSSGSMDRELLGKALGAIASYAISRDVRRVRVVHCDAAPYDQGYVEAEALLHGTVGVHGRGGTVLQPGIDLLQTARDFPDDAPILIITDGQCDVLAVKRKVAYLVPEGNALPFTPTGPLFRVS